MDDQGLFTNTFTILEKVLDFRSQRHNLIVSNIANMDTPRFQAVDLRFEDRLRDAMEGAKSGVMRTSHKRHFPIGGQDIRFVKPDIVLSPSLLLSNDLNTVDIEKEMGKLAENNLLYNVTARILSKKLGGIRNAIEKGGQ